MNVLLISPHMQKPNGGIAAWTNLYLNGCQNTGISPKVLNIATAGRRAKNGSAKISFLDEIYRTKRILKDLNSFLKKTDFNVAHINTSCGRFGIIRDYLTVKIIKKKQPDAKIITHFHCDIPVQIRTKTGKKYLGKLLALSNENLVLCEASRVYLKNEFCANGVKIPNFLDEQIVLDDFKTIRNNVEKILFVGRVSEAKGAREIYELARHFPNITFELVGAVSENVSKWDTPTNIILSGSIDHNEIFNKMDEADAFLFPSHSEGFSIALAEAMARGLPAVATDVGANYDMIENKGGVVVSVGDIDAMRSAINQLIDPDVRSRMSQWNIEKVRSKYLTTNVMRELLNKYEGI